MRIVRPRTVEVQPRGAAWSAAPVYRYMRVPTDEIPAGHVIVHNHVRPTPHLGSRGFRAWTQLPTDRLEPCACGWAGRVHYRVIRMVTQR